MVSSLRFFWNFGIGALICCCFSGCASQRQVVVGLSPELEDYYAMYPSIEFDAVAVTSEEADQIKSQGVDKYFAPASALRKRLDPFTVYFSQERTQPETLPYRSNYWDRWLKKKPVTLVLIADLPHSPDMPDDDPRVLYIDLKKDGLFVKPVYVEIEPQKITRIFDKPKDPRTHLPAENQKPDTQGTDTRIHGDAEREK
ncbi:MAG: hypothetical protein LBP88_03720 [Treponema sp.]|jgi:hypothetical protein|nr:hypothetical protein [Treponema sp.]